MGLFDAIWSGPQVDTTVLDLYNKQVKDAAAREKARQAQIKLGTKNINNAFKGYNNQFYQDRQNAMLGYYQPQLDDQVNKAKSALSFAFARAGTGNSTMAGQRGTDLDKAYALQEADLTSKAQQDAENLKGQVATQKSAALNQLNTSADATQAANDALARTTLLNQTPSYSPLGDIFTGITSGIGNYIGANQAASGYNAYYGNRSGGGSNPVRSVN